MKVRIGFVSNSSSSSFIIAGILIEDAGEKKLISLDRNKKLKELIDKLENGEEIDGLQYANNDITITLGLPISSTYNCSITELDIKELTEKLADAKTILSKYNINPNKVKLLHSGDHC